MTQSNGEARANEEGEPTGPVIRDKRKVDPHTGAVREPKAGEQTDAASEVPVDDASASRVDDEDRQSQDWVADDAADMTGAAVEDSPSVGESLSSDAQSAADRLEDLRRLQAEFVNYRRRVDRERAKDRDAAVGSALEAMLPLLDDIHSAREHGDLEEGPVVAIVDKLQSTLGRLGAEIFGTVGDTFDPAMHEALMKLPDADLPEGATETTIVQVIQPGFRVGERLVRAARVAVADPS